MAKLQTIEEKRQHINSSDTQQHIKRLINDSEYAQQPDEDKLNPWHDHRDILKGNISRFDAMGIQLTSLALEKAFSEQDPPSQETKQLMQKFLVSSIGNNKLNSFLTQDSIKNVEGYSNYLTKSYAIHNTAYFAFKTRNLNQMEAALDKLERIHESITLGQPIQKEDKLSLKEFAIVSDLSKTLSILEPIQKAGFIEGSEKLEKMYAGAKKAKDIISNLESELNTELQAVGHGVLILDDTAKKSTLLGKNMGFVDKIVKLFSSHGHGSMLHFDKAQKSKRSHINPGLLHDDFNIERQLYSDMYKIDPIALIPEEKRKLLHQLYGDNWRQEIASKFQVIENQMHANIFKNFASVNASSKNDQYLAGLADVVPFGHKQLKSNNFKEIHSKIINGEFNRSDRNTKMICSEFCATTIVGSLVELNEQIKMDLKEKQGSQEVNSQQEQDIVKIPFSKHENFHKIHPDRLLKILKKHNCLEPVITKASEYIKDMAEAISKKAKRHTSEKTASNMQPLPKNLTKPLSRSIR